MTDESIIKVAQMTRLAMDTRQIAKALGISWQHASQLQRRAREVGLINRTRYARGHSLLNDMLSNTLLRRGSVTQILSALDDDTIDYILSRLGKRTSLHYVIVELINEAARNSGHGETSGDEGSGGDAR